MQTFNSFIHHLMLRVLLWLGCFFGMDVSTHGPMPGTCNLGVKAFPQLGGGFRKNLGIFHQKASDLCTAIGFE